MAWAAIRARWREKHGSGPPERDLHVDGRIRRGWWFTNEYAPQMEPAE